MRFFRKPAPLLLLLTLPAAALASPKASAGRNQIVDEGSTVKLDGAGSSDRQGRPLSFDWYQTRGPDVAFGPGDTSKIAFAAPSLPNNEPVALGFRLGVDAGDGKASFDEVFVVVLNRNTAPQAGLEAPGAADRADAVVASAAGSTDRDGDDLRFLWSQTAGPPVRLSGLESAQTVVSFGPLPRGVATPYRVTLRCRVSDGLGGASDAQTVLLVDDAFQKTLQGLGLKTPDAKPDLLAQQMEWGRDDLRRQRMAAVLEAELATSAQAREKKDLRAARRSAINALGIDPSSPRAVETALAADAQEQAAFFERLRRGHAAFIDRDYLSAIRAYSAAAETERANRLTPSLLNVCVAALETQAAASFRPVQTVKLTRPARDPAGSHQLYTEGLMLYANGRLREATAAWKRAVDLDRDNKFAVNAYQRVIAELSPR